MNLLAPIMIAIGFVVFEFDCIIKALSKLTAAVAKLLASLAELLHILHR